MTGLITLQIASVATRQRCLVGQVFDGWKSFPTGALLYNSACPDPWPRPKPPG
jgi:hypothetical protein